MEVNIASKGGQKSFNYADSSVEQAQNVQTNDKKQSYVVRDVEDKSSKNEPVREADAKKAVAKINKLLEGKSTHIEYDKDKRFNQVMIMKVVDNNTHKVINEIPSKQVLDMVAQFCQMAGLILDKKV
jgi:flagellar protein FlaG